MIKPIGTVEQGAYQGQSYVALESLEGKVWPQWQLVELRDGNDLAIREVREAELEAE